MNRFCNRRSAIRIVSALLLTTAPVAFAAAAAKAAAEKPAKENPGVSCHDLVENFCADLWRSPNSGNMDLKSGGQVYKLRFGKTKNGISEARYAFVDSLVKNFRYLPEDIQESFKKTKLEQTLRAYLHRKDTKKLELADNFRPEYARNMLSFLNEAVRPVVMARTEKVFPGYVRMRAEEMSNELDQTFEKNEDQVWSEIFVATWKNNQSWAQIKELFKLLQQEYVIVINEDPDLTPELKAEAIRNLKSVKLVIPGENVTNSNSSRWHTCGIDMNNAFYSGYWHELTICAGDFTSNEGLLTLAHEMGHSFSLGRRLRTYWKESDYGRSVAGLYERSCQDRRFSCEEWEKVKKRLPREGESLASYKYDDAKYLDTFVDRELSPVPEGGELTKLADRLNRGTLRSEVNGRYLEGILKPMEVLANGAEVKNFKYLSACRNYSRWPNTEQVYENEALQFELFFANEYFCRIQKKESETDALRESIKTASELTQDAWKLFMRVPGRFSGWQDARDEGFAHDIEEDLVDAFSSRVVARMLAKNPRIEERRARYLANVATFCDAPSFRERYPKEVGVLREFTNLSHSVGQDRRDKLMTPNIREVLQCR